MESRWNIAAEARLSPVRIAYAKWVLGGVIAAGMLGVSAVGAEAATASAFGLAVAGSVSVAVLAAPLLSIGEIPAALLICILGLAYVPAGWTALAVGFPERWLPTSEEALVLASLAFMGQLVITAVAALWGRRSVAMRLVGRTLQDVLGGEGREQAYIWTVLCLVAVTAIAAVRDGTWTFWSYDQKADPRELAGSVRFSLLYDRALLAGCALAGFKLSRRGVSLRRWGALAAGIVVLLFILQSRRTLVAGIALLALPQLPLVARMRRAGLRRVVLAIAGAALVVGAALYGSHLWRLAVRERAEDLAGQLENMTRVQLERDSAVEQVRNRLTYLWLDTAAMEMARRRSVRSELLYDAFAAHVVGNIPGALYPDKYRHRGSSCEPLFGINGDLPCTPITEGVLMGGLPGLFIVGFFWGLAVAVASALYALGTAQGVVLSAVVLADLIIIETSAFPIVRALRNLALVIAATVPVVWAWSAVIRYKSSGRGSATSDSLEA